MFPAVADEAAVFVCETSPSSPGLRTRIEMFVLLGSICAAPDAAPACCAVVADWPDTWTFPGSAAATAARARQTAVVSTSARISFLITPPNSWRTAAFAAAHLDTSRGLTGPRAPVVAQSATARQREGEEAAQQGKGEKCHAPDQGGGQERR